MSLVGAGAVGPAIARLLFEAGWQVAVVASRRMASAEATVAFLGAGSASADNRAAAAAADLLVLAVPDRALPDVACEVAGDLRPGALAFHLSGALSSEVLAPVRASGALAGSIHPLQTFAEPASALARIRESRLFYEGDDPERLRAVAEDLGGRPVRIEAAAKVLYHAGAAAACNLAVAMVDLGAGLFEAAGIPRAEALEALLPLLRGAVDNLARVGLPAALTGPVSRGDAGTVRAHVEAIRRAAPGLHAAYAAASAHAVSVALRKGTLDPAGAETILALLR